MFGPLDFNSLPVLSVLLILLYLFSWDQLFLQFQYQMPEDLSSKNSEKRKNAILVQHNPYRTDLIPQETILLSAACSICHI